MTQSWEIFLDDSEQNILQQIPNLLPISLSEELCNVDDESQNAFISPSVQQSRPPTTHSSTPPSIKDATGDIKDYSHVPDHLNISSPRDQIMDGFINGPRSAPKYVSHLSSDNISLNNNYLGNHATNYSMTNYNSNNSISSTNSYSNIENYGSVGYYNGYSNPYNTYNNSHSALNTTSYVYDITIPEPKNNNYFKVQFHPNRSTVVCNPNGLNLAVGDYVLTEADRGYDIGQIISEISESELHSHHSSNNYNNDSSSDSGSNNGDANGNKPIIRKATQHEIYMLQSKQQKEEKAREICQEKANELGLPMTVTSTEYQFDGKKLTVYFRATEYIDFRNLVHTLFRVFGTRIWMVWYDGQAPVRDVFTHNITARHRNNKWAAA
ncbi:hypothetical protein TRFO_42456 [Tritrichomonas foetus]|uniref:PSP1 C-terminal domain-containing protein n=1 Tax=Tritrichomonas foetus TaxID=1144522 RepID=A0A1J4L0V6_9EUKA|nr:hypothetical protein TRFO_42456 [Tritrichomonas foetus]|eukprot:OHT15598.1 hypothetical protein TRFO_42456 [Tritrichomonas foetus]